MHTFSSWLFNHLDKIEFKTYFFKMLKIQSLKYIQKINMNIKLEDIFKTLFQSCWSWRLYFKNNVNNVVDEDDFINHIIKAWSRLRSSRSCLQSLFLFSFSFFVFNSDYNKFMMFKTWWLSLKKGSLCNEKHYIIIFSLWTILTLHLDHTVNKFYIIYLYKIHFNDFWYALW